VLTVIPAYTFRSSRPSRKAPCEPARATRRRTPGDLVVLTTSSASSPGHRVVRQMVHWYTDRSYTTGPSKVRIVFCLRPTLCMAWSQHNRGSRRRPLPTLDNACSRILAPAACTAVRSAASVASRSIVPQ